MVRLAPKCSLHQPAARSLPRHKFGRRLILPCICAGQHAMGSFNDLGTQSWLLPLGRVHKHDNPLRPDALHADMTSRKVHLLAAVAIVLLSGCVSGGPGAYYRVCEPYRDAADKYHPGFYCPRLSDEKVHLYCCHRGNQTLKFCCNRTIFEEIMNVNLTAEAVGQAQNNYGSLIGVWIYGFIMLMLIAVDLLFYCTSNYELCRVYLGKCGLQFLWGPRCGGGSPDHSASSPNNPQLSAPSRELRSASSPLLRTTQA
uniref:protein shisa-like-1 n=1 Tax=Myxine glutinosa TaxID=7769 RepID=UPI00358EA0F4